MGKRVVIIGAGAHGQVVADILFCMRDFDRKLTLIGYVDDNADFLPREILNLPVLGKITDLESIEHDFAIVAIGDNKKREMIFGDLRSRGENFFSACHPSAIISHSVRIGLGSMICAGVVINVGSNVADNIILNTGCFIGHHSIVDSHSHIASGSRIGGKSKIGEGTLIGINSVVMPGMKVGSNCIVGALTLVNKDISDNDIVVGIPCRSIKRKA